MLFVIPRDAPCPCCGRAVKDHKPPRTMREIAERVCERHGLSLAELRGPGRERRLAHPRWEAMAEMYGEQAREGGKRWTLCQIGRFFGRDHSTVIHGLRRLKAYAPRRAGQ